MSPVVQELPHATIACVPVLNWCRDNALAERAAVSIAASMSFLVIGLAPLDKASIPATTPKQIVTPGAALRATLARKKFRVGPFWNSSSPVVKLT